MSCYFYTLASCDERRESPKGLVGMMELRIIALVGEGVAASCMNAQARVISFLTLTSSARCGLLVQSHLGRLLCRCDRLFLHFHLFLLNAVCRGEGGKG